MADTIIKTGCLPYEDGSGFKIDIQIKPPCDYFPHDRVVLNPDSVFTCFSIDDWPEVKAGIERAINARRQLDT